MRLTVAGSGDAFGAGGRLQTCFHIDVGHTNFLLDCGATALIGLRKFHLDPNAVSTVFVTHLHGDHYAGLAWLLIDAALVSKRTAPLVVAGPAGIEERFHVAAEALFPGSTQVERKFDLTFREYREREPIEINGITATPFEVKHFSGAPPYALRLQVGGKVLSYTGDTEWVEALIPAAQGADLLIAECYQYDVALKFHLDYQTLASNFSRLAAKKILLTHMSEAMLAHRHRVKKELCLLADDGMTIDV